MTDSLHIGFTNPGAGDGLPLPLITPALDVPNGGLLCALPALLAVGLLAGVERHLQLPKG